MPRALADSSSLVAMVTWLQDTMLGTTATTIAGLAVAFVGVLMLTGRLNWRHGTTVVVGCFILFGAPWIATVIRSSSGQSDLTTPVTAPPPPDFGKLIALPSTAPPVPYDPYAGAAVQRAPQPIQ